MICEVCRQNNADIIFKTVTGNQVATKAMCMSCAHNMQQDMIKMFMALGFKREQVEENQPAPETKAVMPRYICTGCGRPYEKLDETTMAGCASCYDAMREDLQARAAQTEQAEDTAQVNAEDETEQPVNQDPVKELRYHLMEAIVSERFEDAARLRDQIAQYEREQA